MRWSRESSAARYQSTVAVVHPVRCECGMLVAVFWYCRSSPFPYLLLMGDFRQLNVWKRAHSLAVVIHRSTAAFPISERYGMAAQLRRSAVSLVSNIAEGCGRYGNRDQIRFFRIARGSVCELECQLLLSRDVGYLQSSAWVVVDDDCREIGRMLNGLIRSLRSRTPRD